MIASIHGVVNGSNNDSLVVEVGGIGIRVFTPAQVRINQQIGDVVSLFTFLVVREDALNLFGFETEEERDFFVLLLGVNGVGAKTALALLSGLTVETIRRAVLSEQPDLMGRIPGVGKKTAQKIILTLQGKVGNMEGLGTLILDVDTEVLDALTSLGYSVVEGQAAIQSIAKNAPRDLESRLRLALAYFSS